MVSTCSGFFGCQLVSVAISVQPDFEKLPAAQDRVELDNLLK